MSFRAKPYNIELTTPQKRQTQVSYVTDDEPDWLDGENYFLNCRHLLNPGDEIRAMCIKDDKTWAKALYEVSHVSEGLIVVERVSDWRDGGLAKGSGEFKPVHKGFGKWDVVDPSGKVVKGGLEKAAAHALAGVPPEKKAA